MCGGGAAGAERGRAGDELVAQVRAAAAEPVAAAPAAQHPVLGHRHPVPHRGVSQARAGQQPAVTLQVRGSIVGGAPPPADFSSGEGPAESARVPLAAEGYSSVTFVCAGTLCCDRSSGRVLARSMRSAGRRRPPPRKRPSFVANIITAT